MIRCIPTVGMYIHVSRGIEMRETCPSRYQTMATNKVSVRWDVPVGRRSDPMSRKLMVSLSVRGGSGVGLTINASAGGGAAWVGNKISMGAVAVGEA